ISSIKYKETELVEEAIKYKSQLIGISSTKRIDAEPEPKEVHRGWKLYLSRVSPSVRAHAGVGMLVSPALADMVTEWLPISGRVALLRIHLPEGKNLVFVQAYAPNAEAEYPAFLDELEGSFARISPSESLILMGDFNA